MEKEGIYDDKIRRKSRGGKKGKNREKEKRGENNRVTVTLRGRRKWVGSMNSCRREDVGKGVRICLPGFCWIGSTQSLKDLLPAVEFFWLVFLDIYKLFYLQFESEFPQKVGLVQLSLVEKLLSEDEMLCQDQCKVDGLCMRGTTGNAEEELFRMHPYLDICIERQPAGQILPEGVGCITVVEKMLQGI